MLHKMFLTCCCKTIVVAVCFTSIGFAQAETPAVRFSKRCLILDMNEGCAATDVNHDGRPDVIAGEHWYAAPDFIPRPLRHILNAWPDTLASNGDHLYDVDGDGWIDVISNGWKDKEIAWYQNPGADGVFVPGRRMEFTQPQHVLGALGYETEAVALHHWPRHVLGPTSLFVETLALHDFDRDGRPEIFANGGENWLYRLAKNDKGQPSLQPAANQFGGGHGFAFGDINGDGRDDILTPAGFFEQPQNDIFAKPWKLHLETALPAGASCPFLIAKLTDSGRNDIIWSKAHDYGIYWWEQGAPKPDGTTTWTEHIIDKSWSQAHVMAWVDIDGDGQPELITGKRTRTHIGAQGDPGCKESGCLYYYHWDKTARKFTRHVICDPSEDVGLGMQICVTDLNGDGRPDIVVSGKTGTWILTNEGPAK